MLFSNKNIVVIVALIFCISIFASFGKFANGQEPTPTPSSNSQVSDLQNRINDLKNKISELQGQAKTLASQIAIMNSQIKLTEARIEQNKKDIVELTLDIDTATKKISTLQKSLDSLSEILLKRIIATYISGTLEPWEVILSSKNASDLLLKYNYLKVTQTHDKKLVYETQQAKNDYTNQKEIFEEKRKKIEELKKQLEAYTNQLNQEKQTKQDLLTQTKGSESTYQQLLAQAQAQLNALSNFAISRTGGVQIVPHSELSDSWGKYYNQRDANWGNNLIGISGERIWEVGCLLTSYAMVVSHLGGSITPSEVAANLGNFWFSTALFLKPGPSANGHTAISTGYNPSLDELRNALNSGKAVIAGLSYDGGSIADHWLVLRSVDGDTFRINDPLYEGAINASLNDHYKGLKIVEARIYQ